MVSRVQKQKVVTPEITRGGWVASGVAAERRATSDTSQTIKAKRTRQNLLDAARLTFAEYGYTQATVEQIVATAGVARGSFYTYFESKEINFTFEDVLKFIEVNPNLNRIMFR